MEKHATVKSDVYSFGITIWEMFSNGKIPFGWINAVGALSKVISEGDP